MRNEASTEGTAEVGEGRDEVGGDYMGITPAFAWARDVRSVQLEVGRSVGRSSR